MKRAILILAAVAGLSSCAYATGGFAQHITGGAGGPTVTVTTAELLQYYVDRPDNEPYVIRVEGTIDLAGLDRQRIRMRSNKTIRGVMGTAPTLVGQISFRDDASNIILERLTLTNPDTYGEGDGLNIRDRVSHLLVTHCTIYDCTDGLIDITSRSDNITVSWCKFYFTPAFTQLGHGNRVSLIGSSDASFDDEGKLHVTFHHNWFGPNCRQRIPSVRFGRVHVYNNYYDCPGNLYGIISRIRAHCLIENNYFRTISNPYYVYAAPGEAPEDRGKIGASGNLFDNCVGTIDPGTDTVFLPPYYYTLTDTLLVPEIVQLGAGADGVAFFPHWFFGVYGDFSRNGAVDKTDLLTFASYWLATEDIEDADVNEDGIVNAFEYSLFSQNWRRSPDPVEEPDAPQKVRALGQNGQVALTWAANTELQLAGYDVYRTTTSGSDYVRLNDTLLTTAGYTDTSAANGTLYYYVVRAVDIHERGSELSSEACAEPLAGPPSVIIQENAFGFCGVDGGVETGGHSGFTGEGYCRTTAAVGAGIDWKVSVAVSGSYSFRWRYANASANRPARVLINGTEILSSMPFNSTGGWDNWVVTSFGYTLDPGEYEIRLEATGGEGLAHIDYFRLSGAAPGAAACP